MTYKTGRNNHDFQIAYFLLAKCHTPDAAYAQATELLEDRTNALKSARVGTKRALAKRLEAERAVANTADGSPERLLAEADLEELANSAEQMAWLVAQAEREAKFIEDCIAKLQPLRKFGHLPDHEAFEAAQREEWRLEMIHRAENYLCSQGFIPHDELATMRVHPDFEGSIMPAIEVMHLARASGAFRLSNPAWSMPALLAHDTQPKVTNASCASH